MKFVIDFDELEGIKDSLQIMTEEIDEFVEAMKALKEEVVDKSELDAITKILETQKEAIDQMKEIKTAFKTAYDDLDQYMNGIDEINGYTVGEVYKHDTVEFTELLHRAIKICMKEFNIDLIKGLSYENYVEHYEKLMKDYNHAEAYIDLEKDYKDDTETQEYIKKRRIEIERDIQNYKDNEELLEEIGENLTNFQKVLEVYDDEFMKLQTNNNELEEYEKKYHPGFFDKHNVTWKKIDSVTHLTLDIVGMIPAIGWVADLANGCLYLAEGIASGHINWAQTIGSFAAIVPGIKAIGEISDLKKAEKGSKEALDAAQKRMKNTKRKTKGASSKTTPEYKKATKDKNNAKTDHENAKNANSDAAKKDINDAARNKRGDIKDKADIADALTDEQDDGHKDDVVDAVIPSPSDLIEGYAESKLK